MARLTLPSRLELKRRAGSFNYEPTFDKVASLTNLVTPPTQFAYDAADNLRMITDPRGKNTTVTYDTAG